MNKNIYILGISAFYHDSAACLVKDGEIIAAAQEERFTRKKHDFDFPSQSIAYCLKEAGITTKEIDYVAFYEKPFIKFERLLLTYLHYAPWGISSFLHAMPLWLKEKLFLKDLINEKLSRDGEIIFLSHHQSHGASAFFPSPFKEAAILTIDGVGEWATASFGKGQGNQIILEKELRFPHSLGLLYSAFTYYCGFRVNSGEYKLMGLAPYGEPKYVSLIKDTLVDIKEDGSIKLNMKYFNYPAGLTMTNRHFHRLFGGNPRKPESPLTQKDMDIARSIQVVTEEIMLKMANCVHAMTGCENLCLAGGVALNCVGNGKILRDGKFKNVWIQPAAGDAGGALGAALFVWYQYLDHKRQVDNTHDLQKGSLLGPSFDDEVASFISTEGLVCEAVPDGQLASVVAKLLAQENVVGVAQGRMEFGPRALGARSILGDSRSEKMQQQMNLKIKFRESFRPFAPAVLKEKAGDFFDFHGESPYMLLTVAVAKEKCLPISDDKTQGLAQLKQKRSVIPAVTHVDYSARVQTITPEYNPFFYDVIKAFDHLTGCPVVINTSFNVRGEPIVATPQDAYRCFMATNMDYLVLGKYLFAKVRQANRDKYKLDAISRTLD